MHERICELEKELAELESELWRKEQLLELCAEWAVEKGIIHNTPAAKRKWIDQ